MTKFHNVIVSQIQKETPESVSVSFEIPANLTSDFIFKAGQYITIKKELNGAEVRRAYSLCSTPSSGLVKVAIKEVENGTFSRYANNELKAGDILEIHPPEGKFVYNPEVQQKPIALFAAGSGITPIMSILKTALEAGKKVALLYGNKAPESTIFYNELIALQAQYSELFFLQFAFSQAREENALAGRIDRSAVNFMLKNKMKDVSFGDFYICGPKAMITSVSETLQGNAIDASAIHYELFTVSTENSTENTAELNGKVTVSVVVDDEDFSFEMDASETILDAALKQKIDAPYSCQGGICSSCIARITEGKAVMEKNQVLTDDELANGLVLTCQAHATTPTITVDYDDI